MRFSLAAGSRMIICGRLRVRKYNADGLKLSNEIEMRVRPGEAAAYFVARQRFFWYKPGEQSAPGSREESGE